ncbi:MAG TPA: HAMP domain-containing sensor histidine kinase [Candidatus Paceibacterota bacterium]
MESVTDFGRRYRSDPYARTETNIIAVQTGYAILVLLLSIGALFYPIALRPVGNWALLAFAATMLGLAALFGSLVARLALAPVRKALRAQKEFIGNIAHELRTPLSIIKTNIEVRLLDANIPPEARALHTSNLEELDRISDIIHNLLSLNALVQPERIHFEDVDVGKLAHRTVYKLTHLASSKSTTITVRIGKMHTAWGNASAIEQVLTNLLKNALNHTEGGNISIDIEQRHRDLLSIVVHDTGKGIKREDLVRIFEPFYRSDQARTRVGGAGSGLGLAIVSELVKIHHGRIDVKSAPRHGTIVTVMLPIGRNSHASAHESTTHTAANVKMHEISLDFSRGVKDERDAN